MQEYYCMLTFSEHFHIPWWLLGGTFGRVCSSEQLRAQMPKCGRAGCTMPTGWRVKLCTGAPSASHQDHDRWSSVQANFLLLWLCLLSGLISNAAMKSEAIEGKGKLCFFSFLWACFVIGHGGRLKGHLVSFFAVDCCSNKSLLQPLLHNTVVHMTFFLFNLACNVTMVRLTCWGALGQNELLDPY